MQRVHDTRRQDMQKIIVSSHLYEKRIFFFFGLNIYIYIYIDIDIHMYRCILVMLIPRTDQTRSYLV